ncbi:hypothetical protein OOK58_27540 [Streptomyces sp. NBC_01728]|uniref:hypothetical protein n=1 Tax=unclassified Streptomyces TaxID=2593676 RepID=UPI002259E8BF|nr:MULTISPECIES: hypothetical protein [unclassified Streptomyces]MCX4455733.1 hypothetical protein [Streptomyces sp. NBC_01719]MCX4495093.1 hypothetical protein [Streptomyces sp. NBC_01728]
MTSVMGLLEEREKAARVRAEELQGEADRILAELAEAEAVLERRVIARVELAEALAAPGAAADASAQEAAAPVPPAGAARVPVSGSVVQRWREGMTAVALAPDYRRIVELLEAELPDGGEGLMAKEMTVRLGLELVPAKIEGVRSKAKRLVERGWLTPSPSGRFMPRVSSAADAAS